MGIFLFFVELSRYVALTWSLITLVLLVVFLYVFFEKRFFTVKSMYPSGLPYILCVFHFNFILPLKKIKVKEKNIKMYQRINTFRSQYHCVHCHLETIIVWEMRAAGKRSARSKYQIIAKAEAHIIYAVQYCFETVR